jgi:hypothetical protein
VSSDSLIERRGVHSAAEARGHRSPVRPLPIADQVAMHSASVSIAAASEAEAAVHELNRMWAGR